VYVLGKERVDAIISIMITFDLVRMTKEVHEGFQHAAAEKLTDFDGGKLFCGATHRCEFVVQLANGDRTYVPSERAVHGGGYGAVIRNNTVGPEGGQVLVA